ncbi:PucR family transcriptional regulator [Bacillus solitudinis]|uniref:PucR family transcriptional regulator n=1 Tax=Bacillus solitudinis TaxID=2014074 RepID=UPI000C245937|nr:helix-turn-helix domain-containing protein [Bacillus solitudinis]
MIQQTLKQHFSDALVTNHPPHPHPDILWLQDDKKQPIGFWKDKITVKERTLLSMLLDDYQHVPQPQSKSEKLWMKWLFDEESTIPQTDLIRFIHFHLDREIEDYDSFQEVWTNVALNETTLLWLDKLHGIIVTEEQVHAETPDYLGFVEAIASDFYVDLTLLIGSTVKTAFSREQFSWENDCFRAVLKANPNKQVFLEHEAIVYYILSTLETKKKHYILEHILSKDLAEDHELLKTVSVYFQHNLNASAAAKSLFMHRNSLQYRIDKFVERTNIDIKQFPQAALMHFLLLLNERG